MLWFLLLFWDLTDFHTLSTDRQPKISTMFHSKSETIISSIYFCRQLRGMNGLLVPLIQLRLEDVRVHAFTGAYQALRRLTCIMKVSRKSPVYLNFHALIVAARLRVIPWTAVDGIHWAMDEPMSFSTQGKSFYLFSTNNVWQGHLKGKTWEILRISL